mgnify:CR=1 FL=1
MLSGKTVTIDTLMEIIYQDYGFESLDKFEVAEWIWRFMGILGSPYSYEDKGVELVISDYKAKLPVDLYSVVAVRDKTTGIVLREMTDVFSKFNNSGDIERVVVGTGDYDTDGVTEFETVVPPSSDAELYTFKLQTDYIFTGFESGTIELQYKAIPVDDISGLPLIPDNPKYIRALASYIAERIAFRMMLKDQLSERKYDLIRQDYLFNVGAAQSECLIGNMDPARMETLINRWRSSYYGPGHFDSGFKHLGSRG